MVTIYYCCSKKGVYTLQLEVAADKQGGSIYLSTGTRPLVKRVSVPATVGADKWQMVTIKNVVLTAGKQRLKLLFVKGGFNFKSITFVASK